MNEGYSIGSVYRTHDGTKRRPVVIVSDGLGIDIDLNVARITSSEKRNRFDVELTYWHEAGLHKPSVVRCSKINTIKPGKRMIKIGELHDEDLEMVLNTVYEHFKEAREKALKRKRENEEGFLKNGDLGEDPN